jgi:hypothetical protein
LLAIRFTNAYSHCNSHANGNNYSNVNANSYWYSFTYTNSNCQAVANAEISAYTKTAPNTTAETIVFGGLGFFRIFAHVRRF